MLSRQLASLDGLKRLGLTYALEGVRLVPDGDGLRIYTDCDHCMNAAAKENEDLPLVYAWAAEWSRLTFPTVQMAHKYAAALMCTAVPPVDDGDIKPPWPYFLVRLPSGLLSILGAGGVQLNVEQIALGHYEGRWNVLGFTDGGMLLSVPWRATAFWRDAKVDHQEAFPHNHLALEQQDERVVVCIGRLVLNLCLAFSDPLNVRQVGKSHAPRKGGTALPREPVSHRIFEVGRPVTVDCREHVRSFVTGDRKRLAVRLLVRGFWRSQPHGPSNSLRRRQWVEPYWKGDVGAPLLTRPHDLRRVPG